MWAALFTAILEWLTKLVQTQSHKTGEDAPVNEAVKDKLNTRLDEWKKKTGAK